VGRDIDGAITPSNRSVTRYTAYHRADGELGSARYRCRGGRSRYGHFAVFPLSTL